MNAAIGGTVLRMHSGGNGAGKEFALLQSARAVEHQSGVLLAGAYEAIALHDADAPPTRTNPAMARACLSLRRAMSEAQGPRMAMEYGEDRVVVGIRLNQAKHAFVQADEIGERAKIVAAGKTK